ncbi:MAG: transporter [Flavobacteriaceae bacterium]|nr:transporter [Flavobacteriaceae bacterium]
MAKNQLFFLLVFSTTISFAQGPPITTQTPVMLGLEGNGIRTFGKFISKEKANAYVQVFAVPYNISSKFQVGGILPYKSISPKGMSSTNGFSDVILFAKYQLYKQDGKAKTFRVLANVKQTFPTGNTSNMPAIGSGLSQTYIGLIIGKITSSVGFYNDFGYTLSNKGATDSFSYNFSVGIPLLPQKYPQKQLNSFLEFNGNYLFDSKIHTLFISPGLQFIPGRRFLFETSFQIPVIQQNIRANKTNYMLLLGTRFLLN